MDSQDTQKKKTKLKLDTNNYSNKKKAEKKLENRNSMWVKRG